MTRSLRLLAVDALLAALLVLAVGCDTTSDLADTPPNVAGLSGSVSPDAVGLVNSRLDAALADAEPVTVVATVRHAENAASAGLDLPPTRVVLFGNPALGTPLMDAQRTVAIDLPQKMLVYTDADGETAVLYNDPAYLARRHGITQQDETLATISEALAGLAAAAAGA